MASNRLKLNPIKMEFMWCATSRKLHFLRIGDEHIQHIQDGSIEAYIVDKKPWRLFRPSDDNEGSNQLSGLHLILSAKTY